MFNQGILTHHPLSQSKIHTTSAPFMLLEVLASGINAHCNRVLEIMKAHEMTSCPWAIEDPKGAVRSLHYTPITAFTPTGPYVTPPQPLLRGHRHLGPMGCTMVFPRFPLSAYSLAPKHKQIHTFPFFPGWPSGRGTLIGPCTTHPHLLSYPKDPGSTPFVLCMVRGHTVSGLHYACGKRKGLSIQLLSQIQMGA